jgi:hypothetical protein
VRVLSGQGNRMIDRIQAEVTSMLASPKKVHYRFAIGGMLFFTDHALCQLLIKQGSARPSKPPRSGWPTSTPNLTEQQEILELAASLATRCSDAYRKSQRPHPQAVQHRGVRTPRRARRPALP